MFEKTERYHYQKNQLLEVICQLRFPTILTIGAKEPVEFQEAVRGAFPRYQARQDQLPPKVSGVGQNVSVEAQKPVTNYNFVSADGAWRLNLTSGFLALTSQNYPGWETFARMLDQPLATLIQLYRPAFFERVGLRYMNAFSRAALGLEGTPWKELITAPYLGVLAQDDVREEAVARCTHDVEMRLAGGCALKLHAGPGLVRRGRREDKEVRWILDLDLSMSGNVPVNQSAPALETLHLQAGPIFRDALTDTLHDAMEPS